MILYRILSIALKYEEDGSKKKLTMRETAIGVIYSSVYTVMVIVFGTTYKKLAHA